MLATAEITEAAAGILKVVANLVDLFNGNGSNISDVFAAAGFTKAAPAGFVVIALLVIQILFRGRIITATTTATATVVTLTITGVVIVAGRES